MNPIPFGFQYTYPASVLLAVLVAFGVLVPLARREGIATGRLAVLQATMAFAGWTGAVLYNLVEAGTLYQFGWRAYLGGGLRYPGAVAAVLLMLPVARALLPRNVTLASYLDIGSVSSAFMMAAVRLGCFLMGCCYGRPSSLPWALSYPPLSQVARQHAMNGWVEPGAWSLHVHPLHIYFGLASLAVGVLLLRLLPRKRFDGQIFLLYLVLHEAAKGTLEFLRGSLATQSVIHLRVIALSVSATATMLLLARLKGHLTALFPERVSP